MAYLILVSSERVGMVLAMHHYFAKKCFEFIGKVQRYYWFRIHKVPYAFLPGTQCAPDKYLLREFLSLLEVTFIFSACIGIIIAK